MSTGVEWQLFVLGGFRLMHGGAEVRVSRRKVASLLAFIILHPARHSRDSLATLFWGDYPDIEARRSLRVALSMLRSALGDDSLIADNDTVQFNPTFPLWTDALAFQSYARQFLAEPPFDLSPSFIDLYQGDLLSGYYDEWIAADEEQLRALYVEVLLQMAQQMRSHSDYLRSIDCARRVLGIEPANERAHQHVMFCFVAQGNRSAALQQYNACVQALESELAAAPMPETQALFRWISGQPEHAPAAEARITNLPIPLTSFVGREHQMAEIKRILSQQRLVTLTGPGGSGKTRLAIHVATDLVDAYKDGVWFVEMAGVQFPPLWRMQRPGHWVCSL